MVAKNLVWLRGGEQIERGLQSGDLHTRFLDGIDEAGTHDRTLSSLLRTVCYRLRLPYPDAVKIFKYLVWHKVVQVDLSIPMLLTSQAPKIRIVSLDSATAKRAA
ncbi:TnsA endonuclease C-terminal domain-containing protein [Paraburkholderia sediminicola]|uniref:TnsA endonuclease C-terminal domain-containing protein n=1 Tax=Paraburkholderia sediminicola TaxID=458836 RepID=UPI0038B93540